MIEFLSLEHDCMDIFVNLGQEHDTMVIIVVFHLPLDCYKKKVFSLFVWNYCYACKCTPIQVFSFLQLSISIDILFHRLRFIYHFVCQIFEIHNVFVKSF